MNYNAAIQEAARLAKAKKSWVYVVLEDAFYGEYDTATEHQLDTFHLGARPLAVANPEGFIELC